MTVTKAEYMKLFKTFSPAKQRRHIAIAAAYALWVLQDKPTEQPPRDLSKLARGSITTEYELGSAE